MRLNRADARRSLDANFDRTAFRESDVTLRSAVTVTVQAEAVGLRTNRLSHHRMMSGNVWDGCKLVRRSYYGRLHGFAHSRALARKGRNVTENRYLYQVLASGTCLTHHTYLQYSCGGGGDRKPRTKSF